MSFLSKLLSGKKPDLSDVAALLQGRKEPAAKPEARPQAAPVPSRPAQEPIPEGPSGFSWGPVMPKEPNQYNYPGTYEAYFESILREEFPAWTLYRERIERSHPVTVLTLHNGSAPALMIELMSEHSDLYKLRRDCARRQIPYLRFYYDHEGWWNTRAYVIARVKGALGV